MPRIARITQIGIKKVLLPKFIATNATNLHEWLLRNIGIVDKDNIDLRGYCMIIKVQDPIRVIRAIRGHSSYVAQQPFV